MAGRPLRLHLPQDAHQGGGLDRFRLLFTYQGPQQRQGRRVGRGRFVLNRSLALIQFAQHQRCIDPRLQRVLRLHKDPHSGQRLVQKELPLIGFGLAQIISDRLAKFRQLAERVGLRHRWEHVTLQPPLDCLLSRQVPTHAALQGLGLLQTQRVHFAFLLFVRQVGVLEDVAEHRGLLGLSQHQRRAVQPRGSTRQGNHHEPSRANLHREHRLCAERKRTAGADVTCVRPETHESYCTYLSRLGVCLSTYAILSCFAASHLDICRFLDFRAGGDECDV